ncbi:NAD-dependent epimerase/dehydratase family protein [Acinetobacter ursingii]|uniref:NAD-dependent epimerase/dehydratase family protein n=1 Tax=Acinetobacter ursingii TaxID=108980 RepID=UPI003AF9679A
MRILITGGAGFIGSNLALKLIELGHEVTVLDNLSPQIHGENPEKTSELYQTIKDKVCFIYGSVCEQEKLKQAIKDQDAIVHLAAETGTGQSMYEIKRYVDVNIGGTALLLDILTNEKHSVQKMVVASSRAIYGEGKYLSEEMGVVYPDVRNEEHLEKGIFDPVCSVTGKPLQLLATDEESKIHPSSIYGITKQNQEQMVMVSCAANNIAATALRYQNVYGPGQSLKNPYTGILSIFSTRILNGNDINIFEDGLESRDFVYIDDVVDATILALTKDSANGEVFGIGSGIATSVKEVAEKLIENYGREINIKITGNYRIGDIRHNYASLEKASRLLGYKPKVEFQQGIKFFTDWVKLQEIGNDLYEQSINELKTRGLYK